MEKNCEFPQSFSYKSLTRDLGEFIYFLSFPTCPAKLERRRVLVFQSNVFEDRDPSNKNAFEPPFPQLIR
jgi:hypothetical protein